MSHKIQLPPAHNMAEMRDRIKMRAKLEAMQPKFVGRGKYIRSKHTRQLMSLAHKARWAKWRADKAMQNAKPTKTKTVVITITITHS
jgi:hypothetical protein